MLDYHTKEQIVNLINRQIKDIKDHLCYGIDSVDKLMYGRGRLSALETLASGY
jgi:hypothetical protein